MLNVKIPAKKNQCHTYFFGGGYHIKYILQMQVIDTLCLYISLITNSLVGNTEDQMCIFPELYLKIVNSQIQFYNLRSHMQMQSVLLLTHL